jgi:probable O-glycosylation ligase (exosortase A-associated)
LTERIESIGDQQSEETRDSSVQGRFEAWRTSFNIAVDHPLTGGGFRTMWVPLVWLRYFDPNMEGSRSTDAHSLYFEVLGEHGFLGLGLYLLVLGSALVSLRQIRKRWRGHPEYGYLANYAEMTQLCLYPYMIAGAFITVAYFDLYFYFIASSVTLGALSAEAEKAVAPEAVRGRRPAPATPPVPALPSVPALPAAARRRARALPPVRKRHA